MLGRQRIRDTAGRRLDVRSCDACLSVLRRLVVDDAPRFADCGDRGGRDLGVVRLQAGHTVLQRVEILLHEFDGRIRLAAAADAPFERLAEVLEDLWPTWQALQLVEPALHGAEFVGRRSQKELMRHESIETTLRYYVGANAERTADACWKAFDRVGGAAPSPVVQNGVSGACASQIA